MALYFDDMLSRNKTFIRSMLLALMLVLGSIQSHVSYYCEMMEAVVHVDCCCADSDIDDALLIDSEPCCEKSVELVIDIPTDQAQTAAKPIKFESDGDPPNAAVASLESSVQPLVTASLSGVDHTWISPTAKVATYLITQRLRI